MTRALVLAAGGVTGALFEVGVLRAVEEEHGPLHQLFDLFIGVSAARREILEGAYAHARGALARGELGPSLAA